MSESEDCYSEVAGDDVRTEENENRSKRSKRTRTTSDGGGTDSDRDSSYESDGRAIKRHKSRSFRSRATPDRDTIDVTAVLKALSRGFKALHKVNLTELSDSEFRAFLKGLDEYSSALGQIGKPVAGEKKRRIETVEKALSEMKTERAKDTTMASSDTSNEPEPKGSERIPSLQGKSDEDSPAPDSPEAYKTSSTDVSSNSGGRKNQGGAESRDTNVSKDTDTESESSSKERSERKKRRRREKSQEITSDDSGSQGED